MKIFIKLLKLTFSQVLMTGVKEACCCFYSVEIHDIDSQYKFVAVLLSILT